MQIDMNLQYEIEQFYYREARTLDERRYRDWLDFFADDVHYWMPIRRTMTVDQLDQEFTNEDEVSYFNDDRSQLEARVFKLETGFAWSEDPPSRTRHLITNVMLEEAPDGELAVESNFMLYRTRLNSEEDTWVGLRKDLLRQVDGKWKIAKRTILLDQTVILSKNLSNFF
jgi:biphenyl 2,3-dioxygenase beta subunit